MHDRRYFLISKQDNSTKTNECYSLLIALYCNIAVKKGHLLCYHALSMFPLKDYKIWSQMNLDPDQVGLDIVEVP